MRRTTRDRGPALLSVLLIGPRRVRSWASTADEKEVATSIENLAHLTAGLHCRQSWPTYVDVPS